MWFHRAIQKSQSVAGSQPPPNNLNTIAYTILNSDVFNNKKAGKTGSRLPKSKMLIKPGKFLFNIKF